MNAVIESEVGLPSDSAELGTAGADQSGESRDGSDGTASGMEGQTTFEGRPRRSLTFPSLVAGVVLASILGLALWSRRPHPLPAAPAPRVTAVPTAAVAGPSTSSAPPAASVELEVTITPPEARILPRRCGAPVESLRWRLSPWNLEARSPRRSDRLHLPDA